MRVHIRGNEQEGMVSGMGFGAQLIGEDDSFDMIEGDDDDLLDELTSEGEMSDPELVGLVKKSKAVKNAIARRVIGRNAGMIVQRPINKRRRQPSGFNTIPLIAGASGTVTSSPQNMVRLERLIVPSEFAPFFSILDIKIGNQSQLVQNLGLPGSMFSEVAIDANVWFDTAQVGNQVSLLVQNIDAVPHNFTAGMIGSVAKS